MDVKRGIANTYSSLNRNNKRNNMKDMHVHLFKHVARFENFYEMVSYPLQRRKNFIKKNNLK